jgi:cold shock CspA family protein
VTGHVKNYLSEKGYGFILGDDGKDYFFHNTNFKDSGGDIYEWLLVQFEQDVTPKGYVAVKISAIGEQNAGYAIPNEFLFGKSDKIDGWEILEMSDWVVHVQDAECAPKDVKILLGQWAHVIGANATINTRYTTSTGYSDNYKYTIHHYMGRAVFVGKKYAKGTIKREECDNINKMAPIVKALFKRKTHKAKIKRAIRWLFPIIALVALWFYSGIGEKGAVVVGMIAFGIIVFDLSHAINYDNWLQKIKKS